MVNPIRYKGKLITPEMWQKLYPINENDDPVEVWRQSLATCPGTGMLVIQSYKDDNASCNVVFDKPYIHEIVNRIAVEYKWIEPSASTYFADKLISLMFSVCEDCGQINNFVIMDIQRRNKIEISSATLKPESLH